MTYVFFLAFCSSAVVAHADFSKDFDKIWVAAKEQIHPKEKSQAFTDDKKIELRKLAAKAKSTEELAAILNPFLLSLDVSHTYLFHSNDPDYYMMRSLFTTEKIEKPKIRHAGMQVQLENGRYMVRSILEGYPAQKAGLRRGDVVEKIDGAPFHPYKSFLRKSKSHKVDIIRNGSTAKTTMGTIYESPHKSFWRATKNSVRVIEKNDKKIGYIHLWCGTNARFLTTLREVVLNKFQKTDALILDLRDGFGGSWWDYLDPFYPDTKEYFKATVVGRNGTQEMTVEFHDNMNFYNKPMVVLINDGVRSGKEALAFNFKKTKRAILVGTPTAGFFSAGKGLFADEKNEYVLYLSVGEIFLDGQKIESRPITPDFTVEYPLDSRQEDPQLSRAVEILSGS